MLFGIKIDFSLSGFFIDFAIKITDILSLNYIAVVRFSIMKQLLYGFGYLSGCFKVLDIK